MTKLVTIIKEEQGAATQEKAFAAKALWTDRPNMESWEAVQSMSGPILDPGSDDGDWRKSPWD
jgi:hypothetical protein